MSIELPEGKEASILVFLRALEGVPIAWQIQDHWADDRCAIGIASVTDSTRLAYVSSWSQPPGYFYVELEEGGSAPDDYAVTAQLDACPISDALELVARHLAPSSASDPPTSSGKNSSVS